jgi:hypothetical protein
LCHGVRRLQGPGDAAGGATTITAAGTISTNTRYTGDGASAILA